jgi:hypothetical protein
MDPEAVSVHGNCIVVILPILHGAHGASTNLRDHIYGQYAREQIESKNSDDK